MNMCRECSEVIDVAQVCLERLGESQTVQWRLESRCWLLVEENYKCVIIGYNWFGVHLVQHSIKRISAHLIHKILIIIRQKCLPGVVCCTNELTHKQKVAQLSL